MYVSMSRCDKMLPNLLSLLSLSGDRGGVSVGDNGNLVLEPNGPRSDSVAWLRLILLNLLTGGADGVVGADTVVDVLHVSP